MLINYNRGLFFTLKTNLNRLFECNAKANIPDGPDDQIIFHDTHYISYPQITLTDTFLDYANGVLRARGALRTGVLLDPYSKVLKLIKEFNLLKLSLRD